MGYQEDSGYTAQGGLIEAHESVISLEKQMKDVLMFCACKGNCTTNRCSCKKRERPCVGCQCTSFICRNGFFTPTQELTLEQIQNAALDRSKSNDCDTVKDSNTMETRNTSDSDIEDGSSQDSGNSGKETEKISSSNGAKRDVDSVIDVEQIESD